jgi:hypothetical protein
VLTQRILQEYLHYDPETGDFTWLKYVNSRVRIGSVAGTAKQGYKYIGLLGKDYLVHRLAWLYVYGKWPAFEIDHINGVKYDNQLCNLREATRSQNLRNSGVRKSNISGHKGIYYHPRANKWVAYIKYNKKLRYLGGFNTKEEAIAVYIQFAQRIHGEFLHDSLKNGDNSGHI